MHTIDLSKYSIHTDLIIENKTQKNYETIEEKVENITIERTNNKEKTEKYTTISFDDITDKENFKNVEKVFINELKEYIIPENIKEEDTV